MFSVLKRTFGKKTTTAVKPPVKVSSGTLTGPGVNHHMQGAPKLQEKFPQVRSIAVNLTISPPDHETEPTLNGRSFGPNSLAFFQFRCKNVDCFNGGFDITDTLTEAINKGDKTITGRRVCQGWHGKNRINQLRCRYELNFRTNINFHEN